MPRILVADDNSNIQKMVALALKAEGIDVVAVGNGDAAVRKMPELAPDLILADIFMPVRNGYEVCEFVKLDPRYMHTPVVLLVGAFDPLDEREAQRVHADGVLKKPFVPPDPLINMVKTLLAKAASERLLAVAVPVTASSQAAEANRASAPAPAPVLAPVAAVETAEDEYLDLPTEEYAAPVNRVKFAEPEEPSAFSTSLKTHTAESAVEMDEADLTVTASRDPSLGEPVFWSRQAEVEAEQPDVVVEEVTEDHAWGSHSSAPLRRDEADTLRAIEPIIEPVALDALVEKAEPEIAKEEFAEPVVETVVESAAENVVAMADETPYGLASEQVEAPVESSVELGTNVGVDASADTGVAEGIAEDEDDDIFPAHDDMAGTIAFPTPAAAPDPASTDSFDAEETALWPSEPPPPIIEFRAKELANAAPDAPVAGETAVIDATSVLPPALKPEPASAVETAKSQVAEAAPETASADAAALPEDDFESDFEDDFEPASVLPSAFRAGLASAIETAKSQITATESPDVHADSATPPQTESMDSVEPTPEEEQPSQDSSKTSAHILGSASPEMIEAVVKRIIDRIQPEIMEAVTREMIRPAVEALVRREIDKR